MEKLYVMYDARCGLCSWAKRWLMQQPAIVDLCFIPAGSVLAGRLFPGLCQPGEPAEELVVVSDEGGVYRQGNAWIMCLFALEEYRDWANRLAHPLLRPLARQGFALLCGQRSRISRWLSLASEREIAETLRGVSAPACAAYHDGTPHNPWPIIGDDGDLRTVGKDPRP
jgi:predicted DCC family thiol-disulfide oxidoreductase YuxK